LKSLLGSHQLPSQSHPTDSQSHKTLDQLSVSH
jgi:hypothetical protein